jgi:hypothetical protein
MRKGWYICCEECGVEVFVSRWRWIAALSLGTVKRRMRAGYLDCFDGAKPPELRFYA